MRALVEKIVREVEPAWARVDRDPRAFPSIAAEVLDDTSASLDDALEWLVDHGPFPPQDLGSGFGEPPITLHAGDGWGVQLLVWANGRTSIHEHAFAGAFKVLVGSSIQRRHTFEGERGAPLVIGQLVLRDISLLETGAIERLDPGPALIHSVFHLDRPTLSLVVRTDDVLHGERQYDYWAPHVAIDPHHVDPRSIRQVEVLAMLIRCGRPWERFAREILSNADAHQRFRIVDLLIGMHGGTLPIELEGVDGMLASIRHARWEHALCAQRDAQADEAHRFFLAVLLSASDRASVLELVRARYPDAPIRRWIGELARGDDPDIEAVCVAAAGALLEGRDALGAIARYAHKLGDPAAFVEQLRTGALAALFRGPS
jgi:hypothetical protein